MRGRPPGPRSPRSPARWRGSRTGRPMASAQDPAAGLAAAPGPGQLRQVDAGQDADGAGHDRSTPTMRIERAQDRRRAGRRGLALERGGQDAPLPVRDGPGHDRRSASQTAGAMIRTRARIGSSSGIRTLAIRRRRVVGHTRARRIPPQAPRPTGAAQAGRSALTIEPGHQVHGHRDHGQDQGQPRPGWPRRSRCPSTLGPVQLAQDGGGDGARSGRRCWAPRPQDGAARSGPRRWSRPGPAPGRARWPR